MNTQKQIKVLIINDEPNILLSLEFSMKKEGFVVFIARDSEESFDIIEREKPKIVLLDMMMPKVDGYEVCKFIKQNQDTTETKIVFLSTKNNGVDIEKNYGVGADLYIPKSSSTRDLVKKINKMLIDNT